MSLAMRRRCLRGLVTAVCAVFLLGALPRAAGAQTGGISGTVTDATSLAGLANVRVQIHSSTGSYLGYVTTSSSGVYSVGGLSTGTYYARTDVYYGQNFNYVDELYDNIVCLASCTVTTGTPIVVTAGETTGGINFALSRGGMISGTVTDAVSLAGLDIAEVDIYSSTGSLLKFEPTNGSGMFLVGGLPTGTYYAVASSWQDYISELYDDITCLGCSVTSGTPISVTAGATTGGINFALSPAGVISGTVTDAVSLAGLANVYVDIFSSTGSWLNFAPTNGSGVFLVGGLPTGTYYARACRAGKTTSASSTTTSRVLALAIPVAR